MDEVESAGNLAGEGILGTIIAILLVACAKLWFDYKTKCKEKDELAEKRTADAQTMTATMMQLQRQDFEARTELVQAVHRLMDRVEHDEERDRERRP